MISLIIVLIVVMYINVVCFGFTISLELLMRLVSFYCKIVVCLVVFVLLGALIRFVFCIYVDLFRCCDCACCLMIFDYLR